MSIKLKAGQIVEAEDGRKIEVEKGDSLIEGSSDSRDEKMSIKLKAGQIVEAEDGRKIEVEKGDSLIEGSSDMQELMMYLESKNGKSVNLYVSFYVKGFNTELNLTGTLHYYSRVKDLCTIEVENNGNGSTVEFSSSINKTIEFGGDMVIVRDGERTTIISKPK